MFKQLPGGVLSLLLSLVLWGGETKGTKQELLCVKERARLPGGFQRDVRGRALHPRLGGVRWAAEGVGEKPPGGGG